MNPGWHMGLTGITLVAGGLGIAAMLSEWWSIYYINSKMFDRTNHYNMGILIEGRLLDLIHGDHGNKAVDLLKLTGGRWNPSNVVVLREAAATFVALGFIVSLFSLAISCQKEERQNYLIAHLIYIALLISAWLAVAIATFHYLYIHSPLVWRGERLREVSREWYRLHWSFYLGVTSFCTYLIAIFYECFIIYSIKSNPPSRQTYRQTPQVDINMTKTRVRCESETRELHDLRAIGGASSMPKSSDNYNGNASSPKLGFNIFRQVSETTTVVKNYSGPANPNIRHWD